MTGNGIAVAPDPGGFDLHIRWTPSTGAVQVSFPQVDHVTILGMLQMAMVSLAELRAKADNRIAVPSIALSERLKV